MRIFPSLLAILAAGAMLTGCSDPEFTVKGKISDADGKTIILEKADHAGLWMAIDSTKIKKSGAYSMSTIAPSDPEIYRLRLADQYVYFPVDSIETITIDAPAAKFATDFDISGSEQAVEMGNFEKELIAAAPVLSNPDSARNFKRRVYTSYLQHARGSVVSYYILTKTVNDQPLFSVPEDARYFAAVATAMRSFRPNDPRLELLTNTATGARRADPSKAKTGTTLTATEIGYFDMDLPSTDNSMIALSSIAGKGTPTILLFSDLSDPATPALNAELRKLSGVNIYNIGLDNDQLQWKNAAANLPWTCVYANDSDAADIVSKYQVSALPTMFIISGSGTITARCTSLADLRRNL